MKNGTLKKIEYKKGQVIKAGFAGTCEIIRVWPFGTVDVEDAKGRCFRVTGLPIYKP